MATKKKKSHSLTFRFDSSPASQAEANALISALSGMPFPSSPNSTPVSKTTGEFQAIVDAHHAE